MRPNYKQLYKDIIHEKYPEKVTEDLLFEIESIKSMIDIININKTIFGEKTNNQRLRSFDKNSILYILDYQNKNNFSNIQTAKHFKISRNSIAKWKSLFKR
jgi:hypothetical protein